MTPIRTDKYTIAIPHPTKIPDRISNAYAVELDDEDDTMTEGVVVLIGDVDKGVLFNIVDTTGNSLAAVLVAPVKDESSFVFPAEAISVSMLESSRIRTITTIFVRI